MCPNNYLKLMKYLLKRLLAILILNIQIQPDVGIGLLIKRFCYSPALI